MTEAMIETRGLGRDFDGKWAVQDLDLAIREGELYGFLGPNGAGKTTTIRMLNGLLRPRCGSIRIAGMTYAENGRELKAITGLVPDTPPLYDYLTGRQYIGLVASLYRVPRRPRDDRADRYLELLELEEAADELCKGYSHGMRKKVHLAAVLVTAPRVLFLDEPTSGLDPRSARKLKDLLSGCTREGTTIMLSTHILETAQQICHRIGILDRGRLRAEGTLEELRGERADQSLEDIFLELTSGETRDSAAAPEGGNGTAAG